MNVRVEALIGARLGLHLKELARLRIEVFRDYPYLYDGDLSYEASYLASFAGSPNGVIIGAFDGSELVGAATAAPLKYQAVQFVRPFQQRTYNVERIFYFGESVLMPRYRGIGIGVRFFDLREAHASLCGAEASSFCAVVRPDDHPLRPQNYVPLHQFWTRRGYREVAGLQCELGWREVNQTLESVKTMQFWAKGL